MESLVRNSGRSPREAAFTLTELLVVMVVLAILAVTQLAAVNGSKSPARDIRCLSNLRQIGMATLQYKEDNDDCYPYGERIYMSSVTNSYGWPMELLRYLGGYQTNTQPAVYVCPSVIETPNPAYAFQLHYQCNRYLLSDTYDMYRPIRGSDILKRSPAVYWMFIDKSPNNSCSIRVGGLGNPVLLYWNYPPGSPEYRRHNGGMCAAAADGHAETLLTPPYLADGSTIPDNFYELGDCAEGVNPASSWARGNPHNGTRVKLWTRYNQRGF
jgi:prepilin-type N-terminal cleavage/methylation domain-containing protein